MRDAEILANAGDAIVSADASRRIVQWNRKAELLFGYTRDEVVGRPLETLMPERYRPDHVGQVAAFAHEPVGARWMDHARTFGLRKNGEEFPVGVMISRIVVDGESIFTACIRDETEKRREDRERRVLADIGAALVSLDLQPGLADTVRVLSEEPGDAAVICLLDPDGALVQVAAGPGEPGDALAEQLIEALPPSRLPDHSLWRAVEAHRTVLRVLPSASLPQPSALFAPLLGPGGLMGVLGLASRERRFRPPDVRLAEEVARRVALFVANDRLHDQERRATALRDEGLGIVAHDLGNWIAAIRLQIQLLRRPGSAPERRERAPVDAIERATALMNRLVDDLLSITLLDASPFEVHPIRVDPGTLLGRVVELHRPGATARGLALQIEVPDGLPPAFADPGRLEQALGNLVNNALNFTPAGRVTLAARVDGPDLIFRVADTGVGIPPEHLPHLFDPFWRGSTDRSSGNGLGLYIAKGIAEAHGGRIWVESHPGEGSTFYLSIPAEEPVTRA